MTYYNKKDMIETCKDIGIEIIGENVPLMDDEPITNNDVVGLFREHEKEETMTNREMSIAADAICNFLEEKQEDLKCDLINTLRRNINHLTNENVNEGIVSDLKSTLYLIDKIDEYISDEGSEIWNWIYSYYEFEETEED